MIQQYLYCLFPQLIGLFFKTGIGCKNAIFYSIISITYLQACKME